MQDPDIEPYLCALQILANTVINTFPFSIIICFIVIIILFFFSAMISGSEIAFFSLNPLQIKELKANDTKKNKLIILLLEKPKLLLATILIANNFINVAIVILSAFITSELFDFSSYPILGFILQVIVITALILFIGEIMPKIYATQKAVKFAAVMSRPLKFLIKLFYLLSTLLVRSTSIIDNRIAKKRHNISMSDLSEAIEITSDENTPEEERKILKGIVKFGDIDVREIMKSRVDVTAIDSETKFKDLVKIVVQSGYSRIPTYKETFDNISGILYVKDLLPHLNAEKDFKWQKLLRQAFFVPENKKINDLLQEFQQKKIHMAIVVDEYGGTSGIVTLEDIIEEIVGEISDEFDVESDEILFKKIDEQNYIFEGKTTLNDFCKIIGIDDEIFKDVRGESDTLAGLILELEGKILQKNESITFGNFVFKIVTADKRRIKKIKVTINN
ncbi:MAG: gliding motility-associated protein GldE [Bacteroidales bacterium]|nr:gliding motility-associated protein GldE [Bacteroidales bacterium]